MKRKIKKFWKEWGLSLDEIMGFIAAIMLIAGICSMGIIIEILEAFFILALELL